MTVFRQELLVATHGKGHYEITDAVEGVLMKSGFEAGLLSVFCRHTSCSLMLMENADPSAWRDLEYFFDQLVTEENPGFVHTLEGPDDMPSHIKMALTRSSETLPFVDGRLDLGTWQGLFLWEHRVRPHRRSVCVTVLGSHSA